MGISVDPTKNFPSHPSEEILEEYVFHRLPEPLTAQIEEHLLICPDCQDAVAETDRFVSALKAAAPALGQVRPGWRKVLEALPRVSISKTSLVPVVALLVLAVLAVRRQAQAPPTEPVAVSLSSLRGSGALSPAPAGKPLELRIEAPDLIAGNQYRVEVVDSAGSFVWKGAVTQRDGKLAVSMPKVLGNGVYWVRLYGADSELLREFGLSAK
jgi:anti-sigma factor RsiW